MSVVVQLRGGLGNQLFQYAAGLALSRRHSETLLLDTALLPRAEVTRGGVHRWPEQLSGFAHEGDFIDSAGISPIRRRIAQSLAGRERALGDSWLRSMLGSRIYARDAHDDADAFRRLPPSSRLNAYCNSPRFFDDVGSDVATQVATLVDPGDWFIEERSRLASVNAVAIHLRWGDYLHLKHVYGTIPASYYRRSLNLLASLSENRPVWLFSDDPAGARDYLNGVVSLDRVIVPPASSTPLENLVLMSSASAIVGANSSFSWWAAYLSGGAPAVFPRPLFAPAGPAEPKDWLVSDWIQLGRA